MTSPAQPLNDTGMNDTGKMILRGVMDRLVPPIDDLPGAGSMGLAAEVDSLARRHGPYHRSLSIFIEKLALKWSAELPFVSVLFPRCGQVVGSLSIEALLAAGSVANR